ncbi:hypothetical protein B296_00035503 [Ensete ventricosum]|uniref:Uncharacterized protein n=1 Tax=Ensete ventricosum TaxID=4639 RepID=A0A426YK04_ENSVE|nr:hypothetical protein B296_00035503 [Ensete ventricosum]
MWGRKRGPALDFLLQSQRSKVGARKSTFGCFLSYHVACVALGQAVCRTSTRVGPTQVPTRAYAEPHRNSLHLHGIIDSQKKYLSRTARRGDSRRRFRTGNLCPLRIGSIQRLFLFGRGNQ